MPQRTVFGDFEWEVAPEGYRWVTVKSLPLEDAGRWLTDGRPVDDRWENRRYYVMDKPSLFRIFADTPPTEVGVQQFANKYGLLWSDRDLMGPGHRVLLLGENQMAIGESLPSWKHEIEDMRLAVAVWDALRHHDMTTLRQLITAEHNDSRSFVSGRLGDHEHQIEFWMPKDPEQARYLCQEVLDPGGRNLVRSAKVFLQELINDHLETEVSPRLELLIGADTLSLTMQPRSLQGALWLQFARAVDGNKDYRRCEACGTWFEVSPEARRKDAKYCDTTCRSKAYRRRKKETSDNE